MSNQQTAETVNRGKLEQIILSDLLLIFCLFVRFDFRESFYYLKVVFIVLKQCLLLFP